MKKHLLYIFSSLLAFCFQLSAFSSKAQQLKLGSNPTQIEKSAVLELESPNQGLLLTRVPDFTKMASTTIPDGMIVYYTDNPHNSSYNGAGLYIRKDGVWKKLVAEDKNGIETINGDGTKAQTFDVVLNSSSYSSPRFIDNLTGGHSLFLPNASTNRQGLVSWNEQTWRGKKSFISSITLKSLHPGSVIFIAGPKGGNPDTLSEDNARFFWDNTNHRLGIGTNNPSNTLTVNSGINDESGLTLSELKAPTGEVTPIGVDENGKVVKTERTITNEVSRALNSSFPISSTKDAHVSYTLQIKGKINLTGTSGGNASLMTSSDGGTTWKTVSSIALDINVILSASVNANISETKILSGWIPKGNLVKISTDGEVTFITGQEVKME